MTRHIPRFGLPLFCALLACMTAAQAQPEHYPSRPITIVVPFPAGGLTDVPARLAAAMLQEKLGLGVVIENLIEITLLCNKMGVARHAFLAFMNNGVMGSMFTRYKSPALVNLDWTTTFTPELLRKDLDLGLALGREWDVPMPVTAATREVLQSHFGAATLKPDPATYLQEDFAALLETMALASGMKLKSENKNVATGLEN